MELRYLRYFLAVAEELNFTRAAKRLNMAQPPLSQNIRKLEERLGVKLLRRTKRRVELTEAGRAYLRQGYQALEAIERGTLLAQRADRGEIGELAIGILVYTSYTFIPQLLRAFRARYPEVHVVLRILTNAQQLAALRTGQVDICFVRPPIEFDDVASKLVARERFVLAMPATHPLARSASVSIRQFRNDPFIMYTRDLGHTFYGAHYQFCSKAGFSPQVVLEVSQIITAVGLVSSGMGVALVPQSIARLHLDDVVYKPLKENAPNVDILLAWQRGQTSTLRDAFIDICTRNLKANRLARRPG